MNQERKINALRQQISLREDRIRSLTNELDHFKSLPDLSLFGRPDIKVGAKVENDFLDAHRGKDVLITDIKLERISDNYASFTISITPYRKNNAGLSAVSSKGLFFVNNYIKKEG